ncbi:Threonine dehydrogenase or related Zn-dependent dehydrogenase [Halanaeroarchaeum sp. HSR-CO]|nr:Threonine dehydrogenase or related Zn-dependent dehydrogenase [Halanaeroarchaeum sp. HSR-CO]
MEEPGELAVRQLDVPDLEPKDILVKVELSGICGSDVHMYEGGMDLEFPVVPGHEFAGVIEDVGSDVETDSRGSPVEPGDKVTVVPGVVCNECWYCNNVPTRPTTCKNRDVYGFMSTEYRQGIHGGFSEYMIADGRSSFYKLPDDMDVELGALVEPLSVATRAFERAYSPGIPDAREGIGVGKSVAIQGAGPVGLLAMSAAQAAGAGQVIAVDAIEERLSLAEDFGATHLVDITDFDGDDDLIRGVKELTPGNVGPDAVIEAAGIPDAFRQGIELPRDGGTLVEVGHYAYSGETEVNPTRVVQKDLDIRGSLAYPPNQFETSISLLDQLKDEIPFDTLFNYKVGFDDAESAYEKQKSGEAYRATIHPSGV